jgi:hypothetical protein
MEMHEVDSEKDKYQVYLFFYSETTSSLSPRLNNLSIGSQ